jgi:imidazolonepropionase-like amidohydrolase
VQYPFCTMKVILHLALAACTVAATAQNPMPKRTVLHAARMLDVAAGTVLSPGEILVEGDHIVEAGTHVTRPKGAVVVDLGNATLMPGLIDAHVHLFLHPGAEDLQTVQESVPQRTLIAAGAAKADVMAGFTAERDMGTEGAHCADVAVRNAINAGAIPGEIVAVMREQRKGGADFTKIYETGTDNLVGDTFTSPYQYTEAELAAAVNEARRTGSRVAVHCTGEPGASYAVEAGVVSIDHAYFLSAATMKVMHDKQIYAVPTFAIMEYFALHPEHDDGAVYKATLEYHAEQFRKQMNAGVPFAVGSDVGPFPHGTQAHELELMVKFGMSPADVLRADLINGAKLLDWAEAIGQLKPGFYADVIAVPGDPLTDISVTTRPVFVMKNGEVLKKQGVVSKE